MQLHTENGTCAAPFTHNFACLSRAQLCHIGAKLLKAHHRAGCANASGSSTLALPDAVAANAIWSCAARSCCVYAAFTRLVALSLSSALEKNSCSAAPEGGNPSRSLGLSSSLSSGLASAGLRDDARAGECCAASS